MFKNTFLTPISNNNKELDIINNNIDNIDIVDDEDPNKDQENQGFEFAIRDISNSNNNNNNT